ncbi:MAG: GNAT family N-acetyltransferase [Bifidobacteriaceae bacterium]|nr:GNAT family N-acetyltransferase [Bifidobacteriaceae bacterium]
MEPYPISADGLVLDELRIEDVERVRAYCQDPDIRMWTQIPMPYGRADAHEYITGKQIDAWHADTERTWAIREPVGAASLRLAGAVSLKLDKCGSGEIGFLLAPDSRGRGLATVAVRAVVRHALDPAGIGLRRVVWKAAVGNWASRQVAVRAGFTVEGTIRSECILHGRARDAWVGTVVLGDRSIEDGTWADVPVQPFPGA